MRTAPLRRLFGCARVDANATTRLFPESTVMKVHRITLTVAFLLWAARAAASDDTALEEILVTARRSLTPELGGATVGTEEMKGARARSSDTAQMLREVPGLSVYTAGGVSGLPAIRGLADDRLRTQVDGADIVAACPNHMNSPLSHIDPTAVASIEVYAGVTPVSVGGDSIGGSILVRSADPVFGTPDEPQIDGAAGSHYRSNGDGWGGNVAVAFATDALSVGYQGAYTQSDDYHAGSRFKDYTFTGRPGHTLSTDEVGSTDFESSNQSVRIAWQGGGHLLDFTYSLQDVANEGYVNQRMDMTDNTTRRYKLAYTGRLDWGTLTARVHYQDTKHAMDFGADKRYWYGSGAPPTGSGGIAAINGSPCAPISGTSIVNGQAVGCAAGMPMNTDGENTGVQIGAALPLAEQSLLRFGGEYQAYRLDDRWPASGAGMWPYTFINLNDGRRDRLAAYAEWEATAGRWTQVAGARFEQVLTDAGRVHGYNLDTYPTSGTGGMGNQTRDAALFNAQSRRRTDDNWDLAWLARFTPDATQTYEIGLAQKTRSPNLFQRYAWSTWSMAAFMNNLVGDGNGYVGDASLRPEVARTVTVAGAWHDARGERWKLRVTPYFTDLEDYVDAMQWNPATNAPRTTPVVDNFTVLRFVNQSARLYGAELAADALLSGPTAYGQFAARLVAAYAVGTNEDADDGLYNIMPLNATVTITQSIGRWRNSLEGEFAAAKDDVSQVRNEIRTASHALANLRSRYERDRWSVEFGIDNLFDRFYALPLGGAYVGQGTTMGIPPLPNQPQWGTPVPGAGRSVYGELNLKF